MSGSGFVWVRPPSALAQDFVDYGKVVKTMLHAAASKWGQETADDARQNAVWEDRTGNARSWIFYAVDGLGEGTKIGKVDVGVDYFKNSAGAVVNRGRTYSKDDESGDANTVVIAISHTVWYGQKLELSNGGRYAIIMSTIENRLPQLESLVRKVFGN